MEFFIVALIIALWVLMRPTRDWYVVEWRHCNKHDLCVITHDTYLKFHCDVHHLTAQRSGSSTCIADKEDGRLVIEQEPFADLDAAILYFERFKDMLERSEEGGYGDEFQQLILRRVVARDRRKAITPPKEVQMGKTLMLFPDHGWCQKPASE